MQATVHGVSKGRSRLSDFTLGIDCISLGLSVKVKMTRQLVGGFQCAFTRETNEVGMSEVWRRTETKDWDLSSECLVRALEVNMKTKEVSFHSSGSRILVGCDANQSHYLM